MAPRGATAPLSSLSRRDGIAEIRWATPDGVVTTLEYYPFDRKQTDMGAGPTLLQRTWDKLDAEVDAIKNPETTDQLWHQTRARMAAEILAMFMVPHFTTADEISREALKRWKARQAGENYETAGLGSRMYEPPPGSTRYGETKEVTEPRKRLGSKAKPAKQLSDSDKATVKQALAMSIPPADLAKTFGVTVDQINALKD